MALEIDDLDSDDVIGRDLLDWFQKEETQLCLKETQEKIFRFLFDPDLEEARFIHAIQMLAWIGCAPENRSLLQKDILELSSAISNKANPCGLRKSIKKGFKKAKKFVSEHKTEIILGVFGVATGTTLVYAAGYKVSVVVANIAIAGADSIFSKKETPPKRPPYLQPPSVRERPQISSFTPPAKLKLPPSSTKLSVTPEGIWANDRFYSNRYLAQSKFYEKSPSPQKFIPWEWKDPSRFSFSDKKDSFELKKDPAFLSKKSYRERLRSPPGNPFSHPHPESDLKITKPIDIPFSTDRNPSQTNSPFPPRYRGPSRHFTLEGEQKNTSISAGLMALTIPRKTL